MWNFGAINWASVVVSAVLIGATISILVALFVTLIFRCRDNKRSKKSAAVARRLAQSAGEGARRSHAEHNFWFAPHLRDLGDHEKLMLNMILTKVEQIVRSHRAIMLRDIAMIVHGSNYLTDKDNKIIELSNKGIGRLVPDYETRCVNGEIWHYILDDGVCIACKASIRIPSEEELKQRYEAASKAMADWIYGEESAEEGKSGKEDC